jgi:succinate-acetate transporter protein
VSTETVEHSGPAIADPAPLGLAGFAMTTLALSFANAGIIKEAGGAAIILALALFYGGIAQFAAGLWEFRRGNTFGATAFSSFGAFWLSYWAIGHWGAAGDIHEALGLFLLSWALFTAYMTIAALKTTTATLAVFVSLTITFVLLGIGALQNDTTGIASLTKVGGYFGILTALLAWYASAALVINATHKRDFLPTLPR